MDGRSITEEHDSMDEKRPFQITPQELERRKRGRPAKQRIEPPKVTDAEQGQGDSAEVDNRQAVSVTYRTITLSIPVVELSSGNEYQTSKSNPPKQIRARPLTREQGIALGSLRLGMIAAGLELQSGRHDFYSGGRRVVAVETKEQALAKLLDMISEEIEKK
jgi:hypothetical protein